MSKQLTTKQKRRLDACEEDISRGSALMHAAIKAIHDEELWKGDHANFADYCESRWGIKKAYAYRLVQHGVVIANLVEAGVESPTVDNLSERATRELNDLEPSQQAEVVEKASSNGQKPTAKNVKKAKAELVDESQEDEEPLVSVVKDGAGRDVPEYLRESHAMSAMLMSIGTRFDQIKKSLNEIDGESGTAFLPVSEIERGLKDIKGLVTQSRYFTECPRCGESGYCDLCGGVGYIPYSMRGVLTQEEKDVIAEAGE